ncbi:hypothetical protein LTR70_007826 [Exophiala xenobiotica]|uniref:Uncharacterized protein n=1 Tax=Lithohypha guttulata TaxID=1690604 RepID=A0ABR0K2Z8_9EURO|nr:hypothetical protein LTR24_007437 [Lithohypha guttulata]KAK5313071.1 hypothetical protein LTR70_007826 [Exophiala xenobiotica]
MSCLADAVNHVETLQSLIALDGSTHICAFLCEQAPLQLYSSALIFAPQRSIVRKQCGKIPECIQRVPVTPEVQMWGAELQKLEGHDDEVNAVVFSPNDLQLASASNDGTV